jgi:hypothetical protein
MVVVDEPNDVEEEQGAKNDREPLPPSDSRRLWMKFFHRSFPPDVRQVA